MLAFLALHREGIRRESLTGAVWPDAPRDRPANSFHATLSQLRRSLRAATHSTVSEITRHSDAHYRLDARQVRVDLWLLRVELDATRRSIEDENERHAALRRATLDHFAMLRCCADSNDGPYPSAG